MDEIRIGRISKIDYEAGKASVVYTDMDNSVSELLPCLCIGKEYCMPAIGQLVLVARLSTGKEAGVILGPFWTGKNPPSESGKGYYRKEFSNTDTDAYMDYDPQSGTLTISAENIVLKTDQSEISVDDIQTIT